MNNSLVLYDDRDVIILELKDNFVISWFIYFGGRDFDVVVDIIVNMESDNFYVLGNMVIEFYVVLNNCVFFFGGVGFFYC